MNKPVQQERPENISQILNTLWEKKVPPAEVDALRHYVTSLEAQPPEGGTHPYIISRSKMDPQWFVPVQGHVAQIEILMMYINWLFTFVEKAALLWWEKDDAVIVKGIREYGEGFDALLEDIGPLAREFRKYHPTPNKEADTSGNGGRGNG